METSRRDSLVDAAIRTLAGSGGRGLTHRAVDHAAGVPEGSSSYYFRTREHLLVAVVERMADLDAALLPEATGPGRDDLLSDLTQLVVDATTRGRERLLARYELALEATRRQSLRDTLVANAAAVRAGLADRLAVSGAAQPQQAAERLLQLLDGLLFTLVAGPVHRPLPRSDLRELLDRVLVASGR